MSRLTLPAEAAHDPYGHAAANHATAIMAAAAGFSHAVYRETVLSLREFEAARMRTAQINGCMVCKGFRAARDAPATFAVNGETPPRLVTNNGPAPDEAFYDAVEQWRGADCFSERERLALEFAERFAEEPKALAVDEAFWTRMHAVFSDTEIVDLAHCVAAWMGLGRIAHVLGFDTVCLPSAAHGAAA